MTLCRLLILVLFVSAAPVFPVQAQSVNRSFFGMQDYAPDLAERPLAARLCLHAIVGHDVAGAKCLLEIDRDGARCL